MSSQESEIWDNFEISLVVFMPNISRINHAVICLYYYVYPQKVFDFHIYV